MAQFIKYFFKCILILVSASACHEWDDHNRVNESALTKNLFELIQENPALSKFSEYLSSTGYDLVLKSSKTFTVWAPSNEALEGLAESIVNDPDKLKQFVSHHISYQEYYTNTPKPTLRIKMVSGKYLNWNGTTLEESSLALADQYVKNGVLHVLTSYLIPLENNWEFINSQKSSLKHVVYLQSLTHNKFIDSLAIQTGVDPITGKPVYEPGTGFVSKNNFFDEVYNINNEDSLYTFIVLTDNAFDSEQAKLKPYFVTISGNKDSTNNFSAWHLTKDLAFKGLLKPENLPDTIISKFGVKVPIDKTAIVETHFTSNGVVYMMSSVKFQLKHKFPPIIIQGENFVGISQDDKIGTVFRRYRTWADGNFDLRVSGHGLTFFYVKYKTPTLYSAKYNVYWRSVNDFVDTTFVSKVTPFTSFITTFQQRLVIDSKDTYSNPSTNILPQKDFGYVKSISIKSNPALIKARNLGSYVLNAYRPLNLFVICFNSTTSPTEFNSMELDYIKLVPQFN